MMMMENECRPLCLCVIWVDLGRGRLKLSARAVWEHSWGTRQRTRWLCCSLWLEVHILALRYVLAAYLLQGTHVPLTHELVPNQVHKRHCASNRCHKLVNSPNPPGGFTCLRHTCSLLVKRYYATHVLLAYNLTTPARSRWSFQKENMVQCTCWRSPSSPSGLTR